MYRQSCLCGLEYLRASPREFELEERIRLREGGRYLELVVGVALVHNPVVEEQPAVGLGAAPCHQRLPLLYNRGSGQVSDGSTHGRL